MQNNSQEDVLAAIILYNPDLVRLKENVTAVKKQISKILFIDNASDNLDEISIFLEEFVDIDKVLIKNDKNYGIAKALNQALYFAKDNNCQWVLTLDQDSVIIEGLMDAYRGYKTIPQVAMITCILMDRNVQEFTGSSKNAYDDVDKCITSACLTNVKDCLDIGGFAEEMFIDYVDYEMSLRLKLSGYHIIRVNVYGLLQEVGNGTRRIKFAGRYLSIKGNPVEIHNESPIRTYYFFRNLTYMIRKYGKKAKGYTSPMHLIWRAGLIIIFEKSKYIKLKKILRGIQDGFRMEITT